MSEKKLKTDKQHNKQYDWLKDYQWKPGKSGNKKGRPPGKTMKEWAKLFLMELPDKEKLQFLKSLAPDIVWKMAEGNPHNTNDITSDNKPIPILNVQLNNSNTKDNSTDKED